MGTSSWNDGNDNWNTPADWTGGLPTSSSDVAIGQGGPQVTTTVAAKSITLSGSSRLDFRGGHGTVGGAVTVGQGDTLTLDASGGDGGSTLTAAGTFTNLGSVQVGNGGLSAATTLTVGSLVNTNEHGVNGTIILAGSNTGTPAATLNVSAAAGFDGAGTLIGAVSLFDRALIKFASGQINTIAAASNLRIEGAHSFVASGNDVTHNSALTGLTTVAGVLQLENGATVAPTGNLSSSGQILLDNNGGEGGSTLAIHGKLTNTGFIQVGNGGLSADTHLTVGSLANTNGTGTNGSINVVGSAGLQGHQAEIEVNAAAGLGSAKVLSGNLSLFDNALVKFASGGITSIAVGSLLRLEGVTSYIASGSDITHNSAITGLASNAGTLQLENGNLVAIAGALTNTGQIFLDNSGGEGGSTLSVGGKLTNVGLLQLGNGALSSADHVTVASVVNGDNQGHNGTINVSGSSASNNRAMLEVQGAAGFRTAGVVAGTVGLFDDALVKFDGGGGLTSIAVGGTLRLDGAKTFVAVGSDVTHNSALTGLKSNAGTLQLENGAAVEIENAFANANQLFLDNNGGEGGARFSVDGTLTNTGLMVIGNGALTKATNVFLTGLVNAKGLANGSINVTGSSLNNDRATLDVSAAAGFGKAGTVLGNVSLFDDALIRFTAGGGLSTIATGALLRLDGAKTYVAVGASDVSHNSALTTLKTVSGTLQMENGAVVSVSGALANHGQMLIDNNGGEHGARLAVAGKLTNAGLLQLGNGALLGPETMTVGSIANTAAGVNGIININGSTANNDRALLVVQSAAGFNGNGVLAGAVNLFDNAAVEFTGNGQITSIATGAMLRLDGAHTFIADATDLRHNSALTGLASNAGGLQIEGGAVIAAAGALKNTGNIWLDNNGGDGASRLSVATTLTNTGNIQVGSGALSATTTLSAKTLSNSGTITLVGNAAAPAFGVLTVTGSAANAATGTVNLDAESRLTIAGNLTNNGTVHLNGGALSVAGGIAGSGHIVLAAATTLEVKAAMAATQHVDFTSADDHLKIDAPASFHGTVTGFANGNVVDLVNAVVTTLAFSGTMLTAGLQSGGTATFGLEGAFAGIGVKSDGHGGTDLRFLGAHQQTMTDGLDVLAFASGTNTVTATRAAINAGDSLAGGSGRDVLSLTGGGAFKLSSLAHFTGFEQVKTDGHASTVTLGAGTKLTLTGGAGADHLTSGSGTDTLDGGLGADVLTGGAGADNFLFDSALSRTNVDTVTDFAHGTDHIELQNSVFTALTKTGTLAPAAFVENANSTNAATAGQHVIYDKANGFLLYDQDGSGTAHAAIHFATLDHGLTLTSADFLVI